MSRDELFKKILKENGYSSTAQRMMVFNALFEQEPLTMQDLIKKIAGKVDKVSVYRTIAIFEKINVVQRLNSGWKYKIELTDKFVEHHHHLICLSCKKVITINEKTLETFIKQLTKQYRFYDRNHQVEVRGYCKDCQKLTLKGIQ